jgi:CrcB protein
MPAERSTMPFTISFDQFERGLLLALGGFTGASARYFVEGFVPSTLLATLSVNVLGCLALGFVIHSTVSEGIIPDVVRFAVTTGFLASFTTYSTFVVDTLTSTPEIALGYLATSYALGFAAVVAGREAALGRNRGNQ